jgi:NADH-quinone oxidoreductase subunit A
LQLQRRATSAPLSYRKPSGPPRERGILRTEASEASMSISEYLPVLLFLAVASVLALALLGIGSILGPRRPGAEKLSPYECGFEAFEDARMRFDVRYYLVAILFIIFDLEIAFLFPWALVFDELGTPAFVAMVVFLGILVIGFVYEWKKGALEWE